MFKTCCCQCCLLLMTGWKPGKQCSEYGYAESQKPGWYQIKPSRRRPQSIEHSKHVHFRDKVQIVGRHQFRPGCFIALVCWYKRRSKYAPSVQRLIHWHGMLCLWRFGTLLSRRPWRSPSVDLTQPSRAWWWYGCGVQSHLSPQFVQHASADSCTAVVLLLTAWRTAG